MEMHIKNYLPADRRQWDQFVSSNPLAGSGHLSAQFVLHATYSGWSNRSLMLYESGGRLIGVMPVSQTQSTTLRFVPLNTLTSSASGPLFAPGTSSSAQEQGMDLFLEHLKLLAREEAIDRIAISYPSVIDGRLAVEKFGYLPLRHDGFVETNMVGLNLDLQQDAAVLFAALDGKCRNMVRRAEKAGVHAHILKDRDEWLGCYVLNEQTLGDGRYSMQQLEIVWDEFIVSGHAFALAAVHEGRTLGVVVIGIFNRTAYYWMSFNARPAVVPGTNNFSLWHAILQAQKQKASSFLIGTREFSEDPKMQNITAFKCSFGGVPYYVVGGILELRPIKHRSLQLADELVAGIRRWQHERGLADRLGADA